MMQSPYSIFNLHRNPFGELTRAERAELAVVEELDEWVQALADERTAIQIVGDCGFGKTTHLLALERRLSSAKYVYYPETGDRPALPRERPVLVDEADRMGWQQHLRLLRSGGPIVIGTHVDYSWRLRLAGFRVKTVNVQRPKEPVEVAKILNSRIEASRLSEDLPIPLVDARFAEQLVRKYDSNLRRIEHFLYERFQLSISEQSSWPPAI
jgi:hypothetical protein